MEVMKKIPYGMTNFESIIRDNYYMWIRLNT